MTLRMATNMCILFKLTTPVEKEEDHRLIKVSESNFIPADFTCIKCMIISIRCIANSRHLLYEIQSYIMS